MAYNTILDTAPNHIAGQERLAEDGRWIESIDPATGEAIGRYAPASPAMAEEAAAAAHRVFQETEWASNARLREAVLRRFADALEAISDDLTNLLALETGKMKAEAKGEVQAAISEARFYAGLARMPHGRTTEVVPGTLSVIAREAAGVAAVIVPWNAPLTLLVRSLAPALAAGCTVVVKPAPQSGLINYLAMAQLLKDPALPKGAVNVVNEDGASVGKALVESRNIHVISFTGSSRTGKAIMAAAADSMKRLSLELGGKSPGIVFPDADLDKAAAELTFGALSVAGQFCMCSSRILVHADVYDAMRERLGARFAAIKVGPSADPTSQMGPVIDHANRARLAALLEDGDKAGTYVLRGQIPGGELARGSFLTPSLLALDGVDNKFVRDELFGPIITLERFTSEAQALEMAHATVYGLAASLYTRDLSLAHRVARKLRFGTVWMNCHRRQFAEVEVGGFGESGLGRLHGVEALDDFLETKHVFLDYGQR